MLFVLSFVCVLFMSVSVSGLRNITDRCVDDDVGYVSCRVRTLDAQGESVRILPPDTTIKLHIQCNQLLLYESSVQAYYFKNVKNLQDIVISKCKLLRIPGNTFEGLRNLKRISISTHNAEWSPNKNLELSFGALNGLHELQYLDLGYNNIRLIPKEVFCPLENILTLNLTHNRIKSVEEIGMGQGCGAYMQSIDLSHNLIMSVTEENELKYLRRLQYLYLQYNNISELSSEAFNALVSLRVLNMSYNSVHRIPDGLFVNTKELREIHLRDNSIYELGKGVFNRLEQLLILDLSNNQLSSNQINESTFIGLMRLIILDISNNALTRIDNKTFKDLFFLQILDLRNNSIGYIEQNTFLPLFNLHTLILAENRLYTVDEHLFNGLFVLNKLNINNNLLVKIDNHAFKNCSDLKELDLSSNQLADVPEAIWDLPLLKSLDLGENQITTFRNGTFKNLNQLTGLRMIENKIGNLSEGMFWDLPNLQVLNLAKNKIQSIDRGTFTRNNNVEAIRLDGNFISDINGVFSSLATLLWLNLSENHLVWFDYAFLPSSLKWLDIHNNFIENLGNYYKLQSELHVKTLDASHNRIMELTSMSIPNSVELLFINNNMIRQVHANTFIDKVNLTRVDIYANELVHMEMSSLRLSRVFENRSLPEFYVGGNPFNCDCRMDWLPTINNLTVGGHYPKVMDLENIMCELKHKHSSVRLPITSVRSSDFVCKYETHCFALCHCCDYNACDCEMTCPYNCTCYHDPTWNTNIVDCSNRRVGEIPQPIPMDATDLYIDGNVIKELDNHVFIGRKNMRSLFVNSSHVEYIQNKTFYGLSALTALHLQDNKLRELNGYEFEYLIGLKLLYLHNNMISNIANVTFKMLNSLENLRLDGNRLFNYDLWNLEENKGLTSITLGNNVWACSCEYLQELTSYISKHSDMIMDHSDIYCFNMNGKIKVNKTLSNDTMCTDYYIAGSVIDRMFVSNYFPLVISVLAAAVLVVLIIVAVFIYRDSVRMWFYTNCGVRMFVLARDYEDRDKLYDAYVCYSPKDEDFVIQSLAHELENKSPSFHLCLHYRDITQNGSVCNPLMVEAADSSKRIILVLSRNFILTEWSRYEFRQSLNDALKGQQLKLITVEDYEANDTLYDHELKSYIKVGTRIHRADKKFNEKLRYAMPELIHKNVKRHNYRSSINTYTLDSRMPNSHSDKIEIEEISPPAYCEPIVRTAPEYSRPQSDHIYTSIDSDYSTMEESSSNFIQRHHWTNPPTVSSGNTVHGYLV